MTATKPLREQSLVEAMGRVPDCRSRHGRRYELAQVWALSVCALACGARSLYAIAQWGREHCELVCEQLRIERGQTPCVATLHRVFRDLDVAAFERILGQWLRARGLRPGEAMAVDGKSLRGIHGEQIAGVHLVAAYAHESGCVLDQEGVSEKACELTAARAVLGRLGLQGHVVTAAPF